jgi:hypothetical protein
MNEVDPSLATAQELLSYARRHDCDLAPLHHNGTFGHDRRYIFIWRKDDAICYNMQGSVGAAPEPFGPFTPDLKGIYHEVGSVTTIEQAFALACSWLLDEKEVAELPERSVRSRGIG